MTGLGERAADVYSAWALLLLFGCMGPHLLVAGFYIFKWWRSPHSRWFFLIELVYGFVNPVVYLLVFQPALFRRWTPSWLPGLCWLAWATYWSARFFGLRFQGEKSRQWIRRFLYFTVLLLGGITLRDVSASFWGAITVTALLGARFEDIIISVICFPLYALPLMAACRHISTTRYDETWATSRFFVAGLPVWGLATLLVLSALSVVATLPRNTEESVRELLVQNKDTIIVVSRAHNLDPRLIASIVEVTQRDINRPFLTGIEEFVTDVWLTDATSHTLLAEALDPSLGLSQVKAHTVLTAYAIRELSEPVAPKWLRKDYRSVRALNRPVLERLPTLEFLRVPIPTGDRLPSKRDVVTALKTPEGNLESAAFLLDLLATQWELANATWSIRSRPDVLATLFQLGFDHSVPKADPKANDFGKQVQKAFVEPWMQTTFNAAPTTP